MPTTVTKTLKSSGGDYTSLSAAEAGIQGNLTTAWGVAVTGIVGTYTAGETLNFTGSGATATFRELVGSAMRFEVLTGTPAASDVITGATSAATSTLDSITYSDGEIRQIEAYGMTDTTVTTIDGSTTDSTRYIRVYAVESARARMPWSATGYILSRTSGAGNVLTVSDQYTRIEYLQVQSTVAHSAGTTVLVSLTEDQCRLVQCYVRFTGAVTAGTTYGVAQSGSGDTNYVINCIVLASNTACDVGIRGDSAAGGTSHFLSCTVIGFGIGIQRSNGTVRAVNCLASGNTADFSGTFTNASNNASADATAPGTSALLNCKFAFRDAAAGDYHLDLTDVSARSLGTTLAGDASFAFSVDFDGCTRAPGAWDIGVHQTAQQNHWRERSKLRYGLYKERYPWLWLRAYRPPGGGGASSQSATVSSAPVIIHAPAVTASAGTVTRAVSAAPVILHAPGVTTSVGVASRTISAAPVVLHAPAVQTQAGAVTAVLSAAPIIWHAPAVTVSGVLQTRQVSAAPVVVHAPAVTTSAGAVSRAVSAASVILHAPAVSAVATVSRSVGSAGVVVHAPAVTASPATVTRAVSAAPIIWHAPLVRGVNAPGQTTTISASGIILHAPLPSAYILSYPVPPLYAPVDDLRARVSVDDLRTSVSVDDLSTRVSLY